MKKKPARHDFPALEQLLAELSRLKEKERIQPRLPFDLPPAETQNGALPGKFTRKTGRATEPPATKGKKQR